MESMTLEISVLRALLRLARRRSPATTSELLVRVEADGQELERILDRLARAELVYRTEAGTRLSLGGLAVAAASCAPVRGAPKAKKQEAAARARVLPMVRRRRAA